MKVSKARTQIINTASELFYKKGYNLTGINEIIAKANIAKATLYSHFKSKEDLCIAYLEYRDEILSKNLQEFCESKTKGDAQLLAVLQFLIPFFKSEQFNGCWCIRTLAEIEPQNEKIRTCIKANKVSFLQYLKKLVKQNKPELKASIQKQIANRIYLLYEGAILESHLHNEIWPIKEAIKLLRDVLENTASK